MAKKKAAVKEYEVLIDISNSDTGKGYKAGKTATHDELIEAGFSAAVIKNWLKIDPPVLMEKVKDGWKEISRTKGKDW